MYVERLHDVLGASTTVDEQGARSHDYGAESRHDIVPFPLNNILALSNDLLRTAYPNFASISVCRKVSRTLGLFYFSNFRTPLCVQKHITEFEGNFKRAQTTSSKKVVVFGPGQKRGSRQNSLVYKGFLEYTGDLNEFPKKKPVQTDKDWK